MTGFDDLNEAGKEQAAADSQSPDDETNDGDAASTGGDQNEPAFPFEESVQAQIYPRKTTHEAFEDFLDIDVKRHLRDREIRNETGRELHEAVLQVAMDHPEEIAEALEEQRRE
ncbi:hypothetical protein [Halolamina rubra]|uniref:hypothetical protein n=1 Tax=Halolamina rubra TaxID=1380430 RepID=UPI0006786BAB|nr:hypothetical protein [Halolamina rubra]